MRVTADCSRPIVVPRLVYQAAYDRAGRKSTDESASVIVVVVAVSVAIVAIPVIAVPIVSVSIAIIAITIAVTSALKFAIGDGATGTVLAIFAALVLELSFWTSLVRDICGAIGNAPAAGILLIAVAKDRAIMGKVFIVFTISFRKDRTFRREMAWAAFCAARCHHDYLNGPRRADYWRPILRSSTMSAFCPSLDL